LETVADQQLLVLDNSRHMAVQTAFQFRHTLVIGDAGSGKTSLLHHIKAKADATPGEQPLAIYVDARLADSPRTLVDLMLLTAADAGWVSDAPRPAVDDPFGLATQVRRFGEAPNGCMILVDDPDADQAAVVFGRLRDELWQLPIWFTVAASPAAAQVLSRPPANAFFDMVITLEPLGPELAIELLRLRKERGEIEQIVGPPEPTQPRAIILDAEAGPSRVRYDAELQHELLTSAEMAAGRAGAMLLAEIWNRGAVSASDPELQRTLGVTRSRLTQLLKVLSAHNVLVVVPPPPDQGGVGRPKTFYDVSRVR
jgi:hypothetical protein